MEKFNVKRAKRELFAPSAKEFTFVEVPPARFLAIDGHGVRTPRPSTQKRLKRSTSWRMR